MSYNHGKYFTFRLIGTELGRNLHKFTQFYNYKSFSYNKLGARNASRNVLYFPLNLATLCCEVFLETLG